MMDGLDPVEYPDIDCLCRLSKNITIRCDACGMSNKPGKPAHIAVCTHGWYCSDACCPVCNGSLTYTLAEFRQIAVNRENGEPVPVPAPVFKPKPKPKSTPKPKPKPGSAKQYWLQKQSKLIVRVDPSKAPRGGQWAKAFKMLEDGMPYLAAQKVVAQRFPNSTILLANLRRRKAIYWQAA